MIAFRNLRRFSSRRQMLFSILGCGEMSCGYKYQRARTSGVGLVPWKPEIRLRVDIWDAAGDNIVEHVAGVEDFAVAEATYRAAVARWPTIPITLRQGARVIEDSRRLHLALSDKGQHGGR
jgi:hypothetical protein